MAALRPRRLDVVLGASADQLTVHHIDALIDNGVHEDFDLDFKGETYGNGESAKRELAADVAALANSAGGVIIVGLDEDKQGVAKRADEPVDFSCSTRRGGSDRAAPPRCHAGMTNWAVLVVS